MIIDRLDSRGVFGSANNATCILRRGFCTSVLFIVNLLSYNLPQRNKMLCFVPLQKCFLFHFFIGRCPYAGLFVVERVSETT